MSKEKQILFTSQKFTFHQPASCAFCVLGRMLDGTIERSHFDSCRVEAELENTSEALQLLLLADDEQNLEATL